VIIPDVNLLVYAYNPRSPFNKAAAAWWTGLLNGRETVGLPWEVVVAFLRITTSVKIFDTPLTVGEATTEVRNWFSSGPVLPTIPGDRHLMLIENLLKPLNVGGKLMNDAHIAALAIEHRAVVHTHDQDFRRFAGVKLHFPLEKP
jgi:toxin-antitoxin system PIN domain toxin